MCNHGGPTDTWCDYSVHKKGEKKNENPLLKLLSGPLYSLLACEHCLEFVGKVFHRIFGAKLR